MVLQSQYLTLSKQKNKKNWKTHLHKVNAGIKPDTTHVQHHENFSFIEQGKPTGNT